MPSRAWFALRIISNTHERVLLTCSIEMNASFKHNKTVFKQKGFDPAKRDQGTLLFWLDGEAYKPLGEADWANIVKGVARL